VSNDYEQLKSCILKIKKTIEEEGKTLSESEFATRTSLINPFLECLGYDSRNPKEVVHEYVADIGAKRGEKVDYAVKINGKPIILIEAKKLNTKLDNEPTTQLRRYFNATDARIGVLTDGRIYNFYSDTDKQNVMDEDHYFVFDVCAVTDESIKELYKYTKDEMPRTLEVLAEDTERGKYESKIKLLLASEMDSPTRDFIRFFAEHIYPKKLTKKAEDKLRPIVKQAFQNFVNEKVDESWDEAKSARRGKEIEPKANFNEEGEADEQIIPPEETQDAFGIIRFIAAKRRLHNDLELRPPRNKDSKDYRCLLYHSRTKKVATLRFGNGTSNATIFDTPQGSDVELKSPADLYDYGDKILAAIDRLK